MFYAYNSGNIHIKFMCTAFHFSDVLEDFAQYKPQMIFENVKHC